MRMPIMEDDKDDEPSLYCSICLDLFQDPRVLPCLHTFCLKCLEKLKVSTETKPAEAANPFGTSSASSSGSSAKSIKCPQCRNISVLEQYTGVEGLPKNLLILRNLIKTKGQVNSEGGGFQCESCASNAQATMYCETCADYICQTCVTNHQTMKVLKTHTVKPLSQNPEDILLNRAMKVTSLCSKHPGQLITLYCPSCGVPACPMCFVTDHKHTRSYLDSDDRTQHCELKDAAEKFVLPDLKEPAEKVDAALKTNKKFLQWLGRTDRKIEQEKEEVAAAIEVHYYENLATYKRKLLRKKARSLENLEESASLLAKQVALGKEKLEVASGEMTQSLSFYNSFKEQVVDCPQIVSLQKVLRTNMDGVTSCKNSTEVMLSSTFTSKIDFDASTGEASLVPGYVVITKTEPVNANPDDNGTPKYTFEVTVDFSHLPRWIPIEVKDISLYHSWRSKRYHYKDLVSSSFKLIQDDIKTTRTQTFHLSSDSSKCQCPYVIVEFGDFFGFVPPLKNSAYNIEAAAWKLPKRKRIVT